MSPIGSVAATHLIRKMKASAFTAGYEQRTDRYVAVVLHSFQFSHTKLLKFPAGTVLNTVLHEHTSTPVSIEHGVSPLLYLFLCFL